MNQIPLLNLKDYNTFLGKNLTPDQGQERMEILCKQEETSLLSPRSRQELSKLIEIYYDDCCIRFSEEISRSPTESYTIVFNRNPEMVLAEELANNELIFQVFPGQSGFLMLKALNNKAHMGWYRDSVLDRFGTSSTDFLDALRHILLDFAIIDYTTKHNSEAVFACTQMKQEIMNVVDKQLCFFNSCERAALTIAKCTHRILECLHNLTSSNKTLSEESSLKMNRIIPILNKHTQDVIQKIEPILNELLNVEYEPQGDGVSFLLSSSLASSIKIIKSSSHIFFKQFQKEFTDLTCSVKTISDLPDCLTLVRHQLISTHAIWLQSRKQWGTMLSASAIERETGKEKIEFPSFPILFELEKSLNKERYYYTDTKRPLLRRNEFLQIAWDWIKNNTEIFVKAKNSEEAKKRLDRGFVYTQCKHLNPTSNKILLYTDPYFKCREELFTAKLSCCINKNSICNKVHAKDLHQSIINMDGLDKFYTSIRVNSNDHNPDEEIQQFLQEVSTALR